MKCLDQALDLCFSQTCSATHLITASSSVVVVVTQELAHTMMMLVLSVILL